MLDFDRTLITVHDDDEMLLFDEKVASVSVCHCPIVIELVEGPPPPRPSLPHDPSYYSSSVSSTSASDEEEVESYCSSDDFNDVVPIQESIPINSSDCYSMRIKRILAWRENFSSHLSATLSDSCFSAPVHGKRKYEDNECDMVSQTSKRSRSDDSSYGGPCSSTSSVASIGAHSCPACDRSFDTAQSLRQHGLDASSSNEACSIAVEYAFE